MNVLKAANLGIVLHFRYRATHVDTGGIDVGGGGRVERVEGFRSEQGGIEGQVMRKAAGQIKGSYMSG